MTRWKLRSLFHRQAASLHHRSWCWWISFQSPGVNLRICGVVYVLLVVSISRMILSDSTNSVGSLWAAAYLHIWSSTWIDIISWTDRSHDRFFLKLSSSIFPTDKQRFASSGGHLRSPWLSNRSNTVDLRILLVLCRRGCLPCVFGEFPVAQTEQSAAGGSVKCSHVTLMAITTLKVVPPMKDLLPQALFYPQSLIS